MDTYEFYTENKEFKIRFTKKKRMFSLSENSQYICTIEFLNTLNQPVLKLDNTEIDYLRIIEGLNDFLCNFGQIISTNLYFTTTSTGANYFLNIAINSATGPSEDDDSVWIGIFEESIQGTRLRISLNTTTFWIEELIYSMFQIIDDIPYLNRLATTTALEFLDYSQILRSPF